jgi:hypothetical protein
MGDSVFCHSDSVYAERPTALEWDGEKVFIEQIISRARVPGGKIFRVRTTNEQLFDLHYDEVNDLWEIQSL